MLLKINHGVEDLHGALGISEERLTELKTGFKAIVENCLNNGIATLFLEEEQFGLAMSVSHVVEELAKLADNKEELALCIMYAKQVQEKAEGFAQMAAYKQKFGAEALEGLTND